MLDKIPTGVEFFDAAYGGAFRGRPMLISGPAKSGKSVVAMQFIACGLKHRERGLLLSTHPAQDIAIWAETMGIPFMPAVESGNLVLLQYSDFIPGRDTEQNLMLPPEGFRQLQEIISLGAISRVSIDTILPWVALPTPEHLAEHVYSFVRAFERMGVSTLLTLPRPLSVPAIRLHRLLEEVVPISVLLLYDAGKNHRTWLVNKYTGASMKPKEFPFELVRELAVAVGQKKPEATAAKKENDPPRIKLADSILGDNPLQ